MALHGVSLDNATAVGAGSAIVFDVPKSTITMVVACSGSDPTSGQATAVSLEYSIDGVNFATGPSVSFPAVGVKAVSLTGVAVVAVRATCWVYNSSTSGVSASLAAV